jgi:hypothetical protein
MTALSTAFHRSRRGHAHLVPILLGGALAVAALAIIAYLLWPTWAAQKAGQPDRLPVSVGGTLFNVPTASIRMKIQRHTGPQERVDLSFLYPSLDAPAAPKHVTADTVEEAMQPIDRIFVSIAAHHDALAPELRARTIYPRYLEPVAGAIANGLTSRAFRSDTPYAGEDLFTAESPALVARCTRDGETPGMCLAERRLDGADLTFRFPRGWLAQWRDLATALDKLTAQLRGPKA